MDSNTKTTFEITPFGVNKQTEKTHIVLKLCIHTNYESVIKSKVTALHQNNNGVFFNGRYWRRFQNKRNI